MSKQAKILIFSIVLVFAIFQKQTKEVESPLLTNDDVTEETVEVNTPVIEIPNINLNDWRTLPLKPIPLLYLTPKNGFSPYDDYFGKGIYKKSSGNSFKIKNSNSTDAVVLLVNVDNGRKTRNEYIRKASNFEMTDVPNGTYYLEWFSGNKWSPELTVGSIYKGGFQTDGSFTKTKDSGDWMKVEGNQIWTVTLYTVAGGDVESEKINADEFFN
jgi:hypothetical protein